MLVSVPSRLSIDVSDSRIVLSGEIDAHTAPNVAEALTPLPGDGDVVADLAAVAFIDSSGLRVIIDAHQRAEAEGRRFVIESSSDVVQRLFEISGMVDHLHIAGRN
jgi:anti-sigma B factor antagonist